ncbi:MAG: hypothetical protein QNJ32_05420 [Xenococcaceae cyanobacterium MO_167.B27]|nr:hypothetical protein [Xenococcaceae cyanobacterium MO_167.B27]
MRQISTSYLNPSIRINLLKNNLKRLIFEHYKEVGYGDWLRQNYNPQFQNSLTKFTNQRELVTNAKELVKLWKKMLDGTYIDLIISKEIENIIKDKSLDVIGDHNKATPIIPLPEARNYFRRLLRTRKIKLHEHKILLHDVLKVLSTKKAIPVLQELLTMEFLDVTNYAISEKEPWITKNIREDGGIELTEELMLINGSRAILGVLTLIISLPWDLKLLKLLRQQKIAHGV